MARDPYILPPLDAQITALLAAYGDGEHRLRDLQARNNQARDDIQRLQSWLNDAAASGNHHPERGRVENEIAVLQQNLGQGSIEEQMLLQNLEAERNSLLNWVINNSKLVQDPPYAIHCKSIQQIYAVHIVRSSIAVWPEYYVFRIAVGWESHSASLKDLEDYAKGLDFEVVPLITFF